MKKGFVRGAAILTLGNVMAQLVSLLCSPVLTRLCGVEAFGSYALYSASVGLVAQVACLKFDLAATLAPSEREAADLFYLALAVVGGFALLTMGLLPLIRAGVGSFYSEVGWVHLLPLSILGSGLIAALTAANIRAERHGSIALSTVLRIAVMLAVQMAVAYGGYTALALPLGQAVSYLPAAIPLMPAAQSLLPQRGVGSLWKTARSNLTFPGYTALGSALNSGAYHVTSFLVSALFSPVMLGYYALCVKVLSQPINLISSSMSQIFSQRLAQIRTAGASGRTFYLQVSAILALCASLAVTVAMPLAPWLIPFVFGADWAGAVPMFRILLPLYALRFATVPVSGTAIVLGRPRQTLVWQALMALLILPPALLFGGQVYAFLAAMVGLFMMGYVGFYLYSLHLFSQGQKAEVAHG